MKLVIIWNHKENKKQGGVYARGPPLKNTKYFGQLLLTLNQGQTVTFYYTSLLEL